MQSKSLNTVCTKMIEVVSSGHNGFGNAHRSMFPTWNETTGIQVSITCSIPLTPSGHDVKKRKWRLQSRTSSVCCSLWSMNQLFLFSRPSSDNFRVIPHLPTALGISISSFRQWGAFVQEKCTTSACLKKVWNKWDSLSFAVWRNLCATWVVN
jgi:hypothetical protein